MLETSSLYAIYRIEEIVAQPLEVIRRNFCFNRTDCRFEHEFKSEAQ